MEDEKHPLLVISEVAGITLDEAREFCQAVQAACHRPPSYAAISQAILALDPQERTTKAIAELASRIHGLTGVDSSSDEVASPRLVETMPMLETLHGDETIQVTSRSLVELIARRTLDRIVAEPIEGKHIGFTGRGPYLSDDLEHLAARLGAVTDQEGAGWEELDWIVIGRNDYHEDYLGLCAQSLFIEHFSQEEFLGLLLLGKHWLDSDREHGEGVSHPGLEAFTEYHNVHIQEYYRDTPTPGAPLDGEVVRDDRGIDWSNFDPATSHQPLDTADGWKLMSDLRKLGYTVAREVSSQDRRTVLEQCVKELGLRRVVHHLGWLIRFHGTNPRRRSALTKWHSDLEWLKSQYGPQ